ncbi:MAG: sugar-binding protein [Lentisphaeria bacterium]|jgi:hypothetical protein|nr:sugar-binding protein [Lentisphaeria bacterium]
MKRLAVALSLLLVPFVLAFNPPEDTIYGLSARIEGVPEFADPAEPLAFRVVVENGAADTFRGELGVWLNDDWRVEGRAAVAVVLKPGEKAEFAFTARALDRVVEGHYPVHAGLFAGAQRLLVLHPIAIFQTRRAQAAAVVAGEWGISGGAYVAPLAAELRVDGKLDEWAKVPAAPLGAAQATVGTAEPGTCQAKIRLQHDARFLYLAAEVETDQVSTDDVTSRDFVNSDYLRLYFHAADPNTRQDQSLTPADVLVVVNPLGLEGKPVAKIPALDQPINPAIDLAAWQFASARTAKGYDIEVAVPLAQIGTGLGPGSVLGMNLLLGDAAHGRRRSEFCLGRRVADYWLNPQSYLQLTLSPEREVRGLVAGLPVLSPIGRRSQRLADLANAQWGYTFGERGEAFAPSAKGDERSGAAFATTSSTRGGVTLAGFSCHPPYRDGLAGGTVWNRYHLELPNVKPIVLSFSTAIRDHNPEREAASDGVEFMVEVARPGEPGQKLFSRFSDSKQWQPAEVDLSDYAGQRILLALVAGPGPKGNTSCDSAFWGEPVVRMGRSAPPPTEEEWTRRTAEAVRLARIAATGVQVLGAFPLDGRCGAFGAGVASGRNGLADGVIAFADRERTLVYRGFTIAVDGEELGAANSAIRLLSKDIRSGLGRLDVLHELDTPNGAVTVRARFTSEQGALRLAFDMPGAKRSPRGEPRFTKLSLGGADSELFRVYLGFGNVIERPEAFRLRGGGFTLSTRHIGADYANGLSLLQASDIYPDAAVCRPQDRVFSLEVPHDASFLFIPSAGGAFAAARHYRDVNGFKPAAGHAELLGRMCLDQWGGDYVAAARDLERAAKYGLNHSIFVKHAWQRWGYDYRLPDIYPPRGGLEPFLAMRDACRDNGILFAPHDNYIDFYPDATGFSYDHIIFNRDGRPQRAWFNKGREAQSYRWLPHAFMPWLEQNMRLLRKGAEPTGLFIDVFTAMPPIDYFDRAGRFYTRARTAKEWGLAFDRSREILCPGKPMLSEAGTDALVGYLDGAQADHYAASRWGARGVLDDRTPWHDMGTHGSFVLLAGGLGHRYGDEDEKHTYGSDDYLTNTVMGGRNPMCDGPFSRRAVMTYWLLHDLCDDLARASFETHAFGASVRQQHTTFGDGSRVWVNRGEPAWEVEGHRLPEYGFYAKSPQAEAGIVEIGGQRAAFARTADTLFADARPPFRSGSFRPASTRVLGGEYLGDGKFRIRIEWRASAPLESGLRPFVHICHPKDTSGERIVHHGNTTMDGEWLTKAGSYEAEITVAIPADSFGGLYTVRYGLYNPGKGGYRISPAGNIEGSRARGGQLKVDIAEGKIVGGEYLPEGEWDHLTGLNTEGKPVAFGPVATNGAFRLHHAATGDWLLVPLPGSIAFRAEFDLAGLGRPATRVAASRVDPLHPEAAEPTAEIRDGILHFAADGESFAYRIALE